MEKTTRSNSTITAKQECFSAIVARLLTAALLLSSLICAGRPGAARAEVELQSGYRIETFSAGASPSAAKIGDLDGDGLNDIAVVNLQGSLQLFFNTGAGSFERVSLNGLWPSISSTLDLDIGDLDSDGRKDIAVAFSTQSGSLSVLLNQGNRTFAAPVNYNSCSASNGIVIGDLDRDGDNDLADISQCSQSGILLNDGQGRFTFNGIYGSGSDSRSIILADLNHDGFKDIVYVNKRLGNVTVAFNNGNATFGSSVWLYGGDLPDDVTAGDFDGDGTTDIAIANSYLSQVIILLNDRGGNFPGYSELSGGDAPTAIAAADFNGDGRLDYAVTSQSSNRLFVFLNAGSYNFSMPAIFYVGQTPVDIAAGKLDGDSLPDLVAVNRGSGNLTVLFSSGSSSPPPPPPAPQITLTVSTRKTRTARFVDLKWSGATGSSIDIYRNGSRVATVSNSGAYTDRFGTRSNGTYRYKVCVAGSQTCSNEATISF
ncbi:MAG TPA: VCBS repeat-containing protein [Blastocatellia bacterium]